MEFPHEVLRVSDGWMGVFKAGVRTGQPTPTQKQPVLSWNGEPRLSQYILGSWTFVPTILSQLIFGLFILKSFNLQRCSNFRFFFFYFFHYFYTFTCIMRGHKVLTCYFYGAISPVSLFNSYEIYQECEIRSQTFFPKCQKNSASAITLLNTHHHLFVMPLV